mmetsp:Transcript_20787/g.23840  ORF Transcript_20787/g.23840 Transcript_20787/m.23840 type:complete len:803 (+) Transcript_20787:242-2650(+)
MSSLKSQRPVYIPKNRKVVQNNHFSNTGGNDKKSKQARFHGAFTGGFSAGHYNTVGSKEGWIPSQDKKQEQRLEDFMDEDDHADWGGPTRLREEYGTKIAASKSTDDDKTGDLQRKNQSTFLPLKSILEVSHETVGPRLLRRLGWREGGTVIVPENTTTTNLVTRIGLVDKKGEEEEQDGDTLKNLTRIHLSKRKLRQIQLQTNRVKLPPSKLDQCGLGFEPYENAPEFQRYREKRKKQARDRASYNVKGNVYRISDLATGKDGKGPIPLSQQPERIINEHSSEYLSYETAEDFVGKRSAGGFALRDDEDDAYDDDHNTNHLNDKSQKSPLNRFKVGEEYNTEIYEHESSDDDGNVNTKIMNSRVSHSTVGGDSVKHFQFAAKPVDVEDVFAAWVGTNSKQSAKALPSSNFKPTVLTSDGKPPLSGFVLGDSMNTNKRRYPGPDIPRDYIAKRHEFRESENPYVSNDVKLERKKERKSQFLQQESQQQLRLHGEANLPLSNNFSSLGDAMKRRFTSTKVESTKEKIDIVQEGLYMPNLVEKKYGSTKSNIEDKPRITISRTVDTYGYNPLVCKRFRVLISKDCSKNASFNSEDKKDTESSYFEREILQKILQHQNQNMQSPMQDNKSPENEEICELDHKGIDRPSIKNLKSVFEPSSDESSLEDGIVEDDENTKETPKNSLVQPSDDLKKMHKSSDVSQELVQYQPSSSKESDGNITSSGSTDESARAAPSRKRKKERRHKRYHRKRRCRKHSHSVNQDLDRLSSNEEGEEEKQWRRERRRKEKKKKKKSSSSRHKTGVREN